VAERTASAPADSGNHEATTAGTVLPPAEASRVVEPAEGKGKRKSWLSWLVMGGYLLAAVAVTGHLWVDPASREQATVDPRDIDLMSWYVRYAATAVSHGRLPALITTAMNAPHGFSVLWNTSILLPGVVLAPVTLLFGPQVMLTLLLTLSFAGNAAALFFVLRRWDVSVMAAALGGLLYGFSPAMIDGGFSHYHLVFAVFPPLMIDALLRIITGRGRPVWNGLWLGVLTAAQLFTGEEMLVDAALAGLIMVAVIAIGHRHAVRERIKPTAIGLGAALAAMLVLGGHALWDQFHGPFAQTGSPWPVDQFFAHPADFVTPAWTMLFHTHASAASAAAHYQTNLTEYLAYLGVPLLIVLFAGLIVYFRDPKVRAAGLTWLVLEIFTLGANHSELPWHYLKYVPMLTDLLPNRLAFLADGAAAALLAFSIGCARKSIAARAPDWRKGLATGVAVVALLPLIPLPYQTQPVPTLPSGWDKTFTWLHLPAKASVLVLPIAFQRNTYALRWIGESGEPQTMVEGYFIGPNASGHASEYGPGLTNVARDLDFIWAGQRNIPVPSAALIRSTFNGWDPAAIVAVTTAHTHLGRILIATLGPPSFATGRMLAWRR
jgi:hypothetical protein